MYKNGYSKELVIAHVALFTGPGTSKNYGNLGFNVSEGIEFLSHSFMGYDLIARIGIACQKLKTYDHIDITILFFSGCLYINFFNKSNMLISSFKYLTKEFPFVELNLFFSNDTLYLSKES